MNNFLIIYTIGTILSGCATWQERAAANCQSYGYEKFTTQYSDCVQREVQHSRKSFQSGMRRLGDDMHRNADRAQRAYDSQMNSIKQNQPTTTRCTPDYIGGVTCSTY